MTQNDESATSGYVVTRSSIYGGNWEGYKAFNEQRGTNLDWLSAGHYVDGVYDKTNGDTGYAYLQDTSGVKYEGEWITLHIPKTIRLKKFSLVDRDGADFTYRLPKDGALLGSNDGTNWELLLRWTNRTFYTDVENFFYVNTDKYYSHFGLVGEALANVAGAISWDMGEIKYYGYEEGSGSLDTTLKSVYNVPATTGTQLEVYYDAKDLTDGAVTSVTDLSPNSNGGLPSDNPQVSNGAFVFDGVNDYIYNSQSGFTGGKTYTGSAWIKKTSNINGCVFQFGNGSNGNSIGIFYYGGTIDYVRAYVFGYAAANSTSGSIPLNEWIHVTGVYSDKTATVYINGIEVATHTGSTSITIPSTPYLTLGTQTDNTNTPYTGTYFNGSIANFRLYSKALNADQVKELYDYQKDYFLGSKSQVTLYKGHLGVGVTEPSGQLELAGDERIQEYPPRGLTGYETLVEGHGVFEVSASSYYTPGGSTFTPFSAFDHNSVSRWATLDTAGYTNGVYTGSDNFTTNGGYVGEWIQLEVPYPIKLRYVSINPGNYANSRSIRAGYILGSTNGVEWNVITNFTGITYSGNTFTTIEAPATSAFRYFRMVVTNVQSAGTMVDITELKFFGTPGPTTLDKGSLSLTRSLDVPRVSRYDVDTETPRPEKLVLDFDTTVNSSPTDISGKGNHGTMVGATYSPADKAFNFDGTDDYMLATLNNPSGDWVHSISFWFKLGIDQSSISARIDPFQIGKGLNLSTTDRTNSYSACDITSTVINWYFYGNDASFNISGIKANEWHHLTFAYEGGGAVANRHAYFDGVEYPNVGTSTAELDMDANAVLSLGRDHGRASSSPSYFNGQISNFKIYNAFLEPSEVQKLYRLGRTGRSMVISDTAVGIGKVPEAQLDVRGNLNVSSFVKYDSAWFYANDGNTNGTGTTFNDYTGFVPWNQLQTGSKHFTTASASTSGGYYTAPVDGIYHFDTSILNYPDARSGITGIFFSVNDSTSGPSGVNSYGYNRKTDMPGQENINASATFRLNEGDTVKVYVNNIDCYTETGHAFFSGYLVTRI